MGGFEFYGVLILMKRVGFIINSRIPELRSFLVGMRPHQLLTGWDDLHSPMSFMRFRWIAAEVNRNRELHYELYKPWRSYDLVVFLKSMGVRCEHKMQSLQKAGTKVIFEANVDYYTESASMNLPGELAPTAEQRRTAIAMTTGADAVIASSRQLKKICLEFSKRVYFTPDNIPPDLMPGGPIPPCVQNGCLQLWWSGMPTKLYDFLLIADVLKELSSQLHLHLVTGNVDEAVRAWPSESAHAFRCFLSKVPHTFYRFQNISQLLKLYHSRGGVIVSPRFLTSPYNQSHTEWKLTLGLACGMVGLGSPLPSYEDAAHLTNGQALRICHNPEDWSVALMDILDRPDETWKAGLAGRPAILAKYGTPCVAKEHASIVSQVLNL